MRYSRFQVIKQALTGHKSQGPAWRDPEPQAGYDIVITGGGDVGRNTTIINAMISWRGILNLIHSGARRDAFVRRGNMMILNGADAEMLTTAQIKSRYP